MNRICPQCGRNQVRLQYLGYVRFETVPCFYCHTHLVVDFRTRFVLWCIIAGSMILGAVFINVVQKWFMLPAFMVAGLAIGAFVSSAIGRLEIAPRESHDGSDK